MAISLTKLGISLVEDDMILCDLLNLRLTKMGYRIQGMYSSGEDAIRSMGNNLPDLILMDINLSGKMDGIETAHYIQKHFSLPVVYLTSSNDPTTFERAKITDDCEYVIKPFSDHDLFIAIELAYHKFSIHKTMKSRQKFLERLVRSMSDLVICTDQDGFITLMNPSAEVLIGNQYKASRKIHLRELVSIIDENGREIENPVDRTRIEMEALDFPDDAMLVSAAGERIAITGSASPLKNEKENFIGVILIISPVSRSKILRYTGKRKF
jgi:CheY-like chemotaxis protein